MSIEAADSKVVKSDEMTFSERLELEQNGYQVASAIAKVLYDEFAVEQVILFGSMRDRESLVRSSDIDLCIVGGEPERVDWSQKGGLFEAINVAEQVVSYCHQVYELPSFKVDLVLWQEMKPRMQSQIQLGSVLGKKSFLGSKFAETVCASS